MPFKFSSAQKEWLKTFSKKGKLFADVFLTHLICSEKVVEKLKHSRPLILSLGCGAAEERLMFDCFTFEEKLPPEVDCFYIGVDAAKEMDAVVGLIEVAPRKSALSRDGTVLCRGDSTDLSMIQKTICEKIRPLDSTKEYVDLLYVGHPELCNPLTIVSHLCSLVTGLFSLAEDGDVMITLYSELEKDLLMGFLEDFQGYFTKVFIPPLNAELPAQSHESDRYSHYTYLYAVFLESFKRKDFLTDMLATEGALDALVLQAVKKTVNSLENDPPIPWEVETRADYQAKTEGSEEHLTLERSIKLFSEEILTVFLKLEMPRLKAQLANRGWSPGLGFAMHYAAARGDLSSIHSFLLYGGDINHVSYGRSPLDKALENNQLDILADLRKLNAKTYDELQGKIELEPEWECIQDVKISIEENLWTYVHEGCTKGVKHLLDSGVEVNNPASSGRTVLDVALRRKQLEIVILLREYGAKRGEELEKAKPSVSSLPAELSLWNPSSGSSLGGDSKGAFRRWAP